MKKATRLLILTAFVFPLLMASRAYAGGPGPGQRTHFGDRDRLGLDPLGVHSMDPFNNSSDPFNTEVRTDGFHGTEPDGNPLHLQDPIGDPVPDVDRNGLYHRALDAGHGSWDSGNGGGTAPIDGGISLLLAAGIGLGIKKARARKQTA
jgi:hypothetical protein